MKAARKLSMFLTLAWEVSPAYIFLLLGSSLLGGAQLMANVVLPKFLIDELTGAQDPNRLFFWTAVLVGANWAFSFAANALKRHLDYRKIYVSEMLRERMAEKIMRVSYACLEDPEKLDLKERAVFAVTTFSALESMVNILATLTRDIIVVAGLLALMAMLSPLLVLLLALCIGLGLLFYGSIRKDQRTFQMSLIPINRQYGYYVSLCANGEIQKDARLYSMEEMMTRRVSDYNLQIYERSAPFMARMSIFNALIDAVNSLQAAIAYGFVGYRVLVPGTSGAISLGSFTMYVSAATGFTSSVMEMSMSLISLGQVLSYLEPYMQFMELPEEKDMSGVPFAGEIGEIRFENVTFTYPGSDKSVLTGVSFDVRGGEKVSVVGLNGAGKTTLVKLLCRMYRPDSGRILVNGRDLWEYDHASWMKAVAAVFQDYRLFAFTIDENIICSDAGGDLPGTGEALRKAGLEQKMAELENGIYSMLGKAYDEKGVELSGGEMQKIAIARALYKNAKLVILDEPTSALDPIAEAEIYEHFNSLVGEGTALYISHRMSSSIFCDRILVIDGGRVADFAPHAKLMEKTDGLYYKLFMSQAENYNISGD
ncbi:MAG TPA: ABC transporter ATP-binding protein [Clostridia bacterium]|nr:MAG: putative ABC transporter ATP-binding protein [Firmicutes bacterium ADurb.Bin248]HOF99503.1 ABC transporter ATP-binding protein [Clostridia bacterium]HOS18377.1 ABC transporter ATP-binding protein [Clostridia bacterium]HPK15041.1 ABC transporter ATP-binding protein [Clostridia bacterium]